MHLPCEMGRHKGAYILSASKACMSHTGAQPSAPYSDRRKATGSMLQPNNTNEYAFQHKLGACDDSLCHKETCFSVTMLQPEHYSCFTKLGSSHMLHCLHATLCVWYTVCMQDSLVLDVDDACHILTVETGGPIFSVAVQSGVLLDLEECPVAVLSRTPPDPANGSLTLATYRCCGSTL